ncbi:hypothetical protein Hypma_007336 [Hypsizygus marmoreus]|uniref:Uncharacterized protein n=1 Tax=Hypsizygus marmoreus TaxID=39966 RepID=A0A369JQY8_HYPMA|nr:hypothetical protein Hypma_007336 [Hypsizygus marmoreus]
MLPALNPLTSSDIPPCRKLHDKCHVLLITFGNKTRERGLSSRDYHMTSRQPMDTKRLPLPPLRAGLIKEPLSPLTLKDIPEPPGLRNKESFRGDIVKTHFLGFIMTFEDLAQWGADHDLVPDGDFYRLYQRAWTTLRMVVPHPTMVATVRYGPDRSYGMSFVVATNRTPSELERASDLEFIERVRTILGTKASPIWHRQVCIW